MKTYRFTGDFLFRCRGFTDALRRMSRYFGSEPNVDKLKGNIRLVKEGFWKVVPVPHTHPLQGYFATYHGMSSEGFKKSLYMEQWIAIAPDRVLEEKSLNAGACTRRCTIQHLYSDDGRTRVRVQKQIDFDVTRHGPHWWVPEEVEKEVPLTEEETAAVEEFVFETQQKRREQ